MKWIKYLLHVIKVNFLGPIHRIYWLRLPILGFIISILITLFTILKIINITQQETLVHNKLYLYLIPLVISLGWSIYSFFRLFVTYRLKLKLFPNSKIINDELTLPPDHKISDFPVNFNNEAQSILYNPKINLELDKVESLISFDNEFFDVHQTIKDNLIFFIRKMPGANRETFDSKKIRLASEITLSTIHKKQPIKLQKTSYFRDRLSNTLANFKVKKGNNIILNLRNEFVETSTNKIKDLSSSNLSNQLGASTILITKDKNIIYLMQGLRTNENVNRWAPSGSGSFDYVIPKKNETFREYAIKQAKKELKQESNLSEKQLLEIVICGFGRYIYRNGKPEIFCVATSSISSNKITIRGEEWDYQEKKRIGTFPIEGELNKQNILKSLQQFMHLLMKIAKSPHPENQEEEEVSGPLFWNVKFAFEFFQSKSEDYIKEFFQGIG